MENRIDERKKELASIIMELDGQADPTLHPRSHYGLYPYMLEIRGDIYVANQIRKKKRQARLLEIFKEDMVRDNQELRMLERAYMISQC